MEKNGVVGKNDEVNSTWSKNQMRRAHRSGKEVEDGMHRSYFANTWRDWVNAR